MGFKSICLSKYFLVPPLLSWMVQIVFLLNFFHFQPGDPRLWKWPLDSSATHGWVLCLCHRPPRWFEGEMGVWTCTGSVVFSPNTSRNQQNNKQHGSAGYCQLSSFFGGVGIFIDDVMTHDFSFIPFSSFFPCFIPTCWIMGTVEQSGWHMMTWHFLRENPNRKLHICQEPR